MQASSQIGPVHYSESQIWTRSVGSGDFLYYIGLLQMLFFIDSPGSRPSPQLRDSLAMFTCSNPDLSDSVILALSVKEILFLLF